MTISPNCTVTAPFDVASLGATFFNVVFFGVLVVDREERKFKETTHFYGSSDCENRQWISEVQVRDSRHPMDEFRNLNEGQKERRWEGQLCLASA